MAEQIAASQQFVVIKEIKDGVLYLKQGGLRKVLMVNGINFDLKSQEEQQFTLNSFQSFLNALDFSVQFFVHSRKVNISTYLEKIKARKAQEQNELLQLQIEEYGEFISSFVEKNPIISKDFFIVVPYDPIVVVEQTRKNILGLFSKSKKQNKDSQVADSASKHVEQLNYRVDGVTAGLEQIGLHTTPLNDDELTELYYNLYNPQLIERRSIESQTKGE